MSNSMSRKYLVGISILVVSSEVMSREISYSYIQGAYGSVTDSGLILGEVEGDMVSISASHSIFSYIAGKASYTTTSFDTSNQDVDVNSKALTIGVTAHVSVTPSIDIYGEYSVVKGEIETSHEIMSSGRVDDKGSVIGVGLRYVAHDTVEFEISTSRADIFYDKPNILSMGARLYRNENISIGISADFGAPFGSGWGTGGDVDSILIDVRIDL